MSKGKRRKNGEGSFYKISKTGKWGYSYYDKNGKRKYVYGNTINEIKIKLEKSDNLSKTKDTLYDFAKKYVTDKYNLGEVKSNTYYTDCCTLKRISKYPVIHKKISQITTDDIKECLNEMRSSSHSTIKKNFSVMKWGFEIAVSKNYLAKNPMLNKVEVKLPKSKKKTKKIRGFTIEEQRNFCTSVDNLSDNYTYKYIWLISMYSRFKGSAKS